MTTHLEREMMQLKQRLAELSAEVERSISDAYETLMNLDVDRARQVVENDRQIDREEVSLEEECLRVITLNQPVAADLRFLVALFKINNDLERMGDLAVNIAEYVIEIVRHGRIDLPDKFDAIFRQTLDMVQQSLDALVNRDADAAIRVVKQDDIVDQLNREIIMEVQERVLEHPEQLRSLLFLISVSRTVERIADYATNICEDVHYMVEGAIIRHGRPGDAHS